MRSETAIERTGADDELTHRIIQCIINVHQELGPGFVEKIYRQALLIELRACGFETGVERRVVIYYKGQKAGIHVLDIIVENQIILELKCAESLNRYDYAQVRSYLKATKLKTALLVNFSGERADYRRIINN